MVRFTLPRTLTLPSGARITLRRRRPHAAEAPAPARPDDSAPLFSDVLALFDGEIALLRGKTELDVHDLPLADFHVVRAVLTKAGLVYEDEVELDCRNCGALLIAHPCRDLETGPWEDGELDDPELDATAELGVPLEIAPIPIGRVRQATTITLAPRTVRQAMPFWAAASVDPLAMDGEVVRAMGVVALGALHDEEPIARALASCDAAARDAVAEAFVSAHYPLRLACDVFCPTCAARNTVDAPALRELELGVRPPREPDVPRARPPLPPLEEFVEIAHAIAEPLIAEIPGEKAELIVEGGTPAVDDGGEPLLGSYVPPPPAGAPVPTRPPTVTVYYKTFESIERDEGAFDWEDELRETIEHELEHHIYYLRGDDPMDAEERAEIEREVVRVLGRGEATRRTLAVFGLSFSDFVRRAWPLIALGALSLALVIAESHC